MQERRKEERKQLMAYTQVFDLYGGFLLGYLGDLTLQGAMVIGEKQIAVDTEITLAIELPELKNITATRITIPVRVVWVQQDISPEFFNIGFEFLEVPPEKSSIFQSIIDTYEFRRGSSSYTIKPM